MQDKISFKTQRYFPDFLYVLGILLMPLGALLVFTSYEYLTGIVTTLIGYFLFSAHYGFAIDFKGKYYKEFLSFAGVRFGSENSFKTVHYIFINKNKTRQTFSTRVNHTTVISYEYDAYIKIDEDKKVHLISNENKNRVVRKITKYFKDSGIALHDYTEVNDKEPQK